MIVARGINIFPSQVEEVIMSVPEAGANYQIQLEKEGALDKFIVKVKIYSKMFHGDLNELDALRHKIKDEIKASIVISPVVELHEPGSLLAFEGKAKRVIDLRPII